MLSEPVVSVPARARLAVTARVAALPWPVSSWKFAAVAPAMATRSLLPGAWTAAPGPRLVSAQWVTSDQSPPPPVQT